MKLTDEQLSRLSNEKLTEAYWKFELGVAYVYHNAPKGVKYSAPYPEYGKSFWSKIESNVRGILCENGKPKPNVEEIISGDVRSLAEAILSIVVATYYEITLAIAIPITALIIKKGIANFCSGGNSEASNPELIKEILETKSLSAEDETNSD